MSQLNKAGPPANLDSETFVPSVELINPRSPNRFRPADKLSAEIGRVLRPAFGLARKVRREIADYVD